jgi:acid phosphatase type 7
MLAIFSAFPVLAGEFNATQDLHFAVISDMNENYGDTKYSKDLDKAVAAILQTQTELVLSTGDMVAGQKPGLDYKKMWNAFHQKVTDRFLSANVAFAPSPGNHDAATGKKFKVEREEYVQTFKNKNRNQFKFLPGSQYPLHYAFITKDILFIALDATTVGALSNAQVAWLEEILKANPLVSAKIIFGHVPLHPFAHGRADEHLSLDSPAFSHQFEKLLEEYKVDVFLTGHHHAFYSGHRNGYTKYISAPLLGGGARRLLSQNQVSTKGFLLFKYSKQSGLEFRMISIPTLSDVLSQSLPDAIRLPNVDASDCIGCAGYPLDLFVNPLQRILYFRQDY